jgi:S1-C subfamily serine protease
MLAIPYTALPGREADLGRIYVLPAQDAPGGTFGWTVEKADGALVVAGILQDGPAETAGIRVGDRITHVDGRPVVELGADLSRFLIASGYVRAAQSLEVKVGGLTTKQLIAIPWP